LLPQFNGKGLNPDRSFTQVNKSDFPIQHDLTPQPEVTEMPKIMVSLEQRRRLRREALHLLL
jgi:hypothetical protein